MIAKELITDTIPPLKPSDTGLKALSWMDEFKVRHLPIVSRSEYIGLISDSEILDLNTPEENLSKLNLSLSRPFLYHDRHIYEVIKTIASLDLTLAVVLDENQHYAGIIPLPHLVKEFAKISVVQDQGAIIILELNVNDYSLSEIAQIVESNDAKILSSYVTPHRDSTKLEVTLKINRIKIDDVIQTFNRYNYIITASFQETEHYSDLRDRLEYLMSYMKV